MKSIDVKTTYLQEDRIEGEVYMKPVEKANTGKTWRLKKNVYGLKAPLGHGKGVWWACVKLMVGGGVKSNLDPTIFI